MPATTGSPTGGARLPSDRVLRIGVLGAAKIAPRGLIEPAAKLDDVRITRVAARDPGRARAFALDHGIPAVSGTYAELVTADDVDIVYNPLPISLHAHWTIAALRAGKHVLCEKPLACNADEAATMVAVAREEGRVLAEAFHYRYHPLFTRILDLVASGVVGTLERIEAEFSVPIARPDIRWDYATGGGALMDLGCYPVSWIRQVSGEEPIVTWAEAVEDPAGVDASLRAELSLPSGAVAGIVTSMTAGRTAMLRIEGSAGRIEARNPLSPQQGNLLVVESARGRTSGPVEGGVTYEHMLRAFVDHVAHGAPFPTAGDDSVANMAVIDALYTAAGLPIRGLPG